ncbi:MAG: DNA-binding protein WhiA [Lachnospirales bacterium]
MSFSSKLKEEILCDNDLKLKEKKYALGFLTGLLLTICDFKQKKFYIPIDKIDFSIKIIYICSLHKIEINDRVIDDNLVFDKLFEDFSKGFYEDKQDLLISKYLLSSTNANKGLITGLFLGTGYITNPEIDYHFEIKVNNFLICTQIQYILKKIEFYSKIKRVNQKYIVYIKEAETISDLIKTFGASKSFFIYEDVRVLKEVRNNVNRKVNCEIANLKKTVATSSKQISDINLLIQKEFFDTLSDDIKETAKLRCEHTEISLKELGERHIPPISKSKVNYRLKKIEKYAESLRGERNDREKITNEH